MTTRDTSSIWPFSIFGGTNGTARALKSTASTIQYWVEQDRIPQTRWDDFIEAAKDAGVTVTPAELFNMTPAETAA